MDVEAQTTPSLSNQFLTYSHYLFEIFSPKPKKYPIILLPILCSLLPAVFFTTLLYGPTIEGCPNDLRNTCTKALIEIPWGGYIPNCYDAIRFISYSLHHLSFGHIITNLVTLFPILYLLEVKYGFWRLLISYFVSVIGGAIFAWWWLPEDSVLAGVSAAIYGYIFMYYADLIVNWYTIKIPYIQLGIITSCVIAMIIQGSIESNIATCAHIGGGIASLGAGMIILPHFYHYKYEALIPVVGLVIMLLEFLVLPLALYFTRP